MAIIYKGRLNYEAGEDEFGIPKASVDLKFGVDNGEDPLLILQHPEIPPPQSVHPDLPILRRADVNITKGEGSDRKAMTYIATVNYTIPENSGGGETANKQTPPWKRGVFNPSLFSVPRQVPLEKAYKIEGGRVKDAQYAPSVPVTNSAGMPLNATTIKEITHWSFSYYVEHFRASWIEKFKNTVNDESVMLAGLGINSNCALIKSLKVTPKIDYDEKGDVMYEYFQIDIEFILSGTGFQREMADTGIHFLYNNKPVRIYHSSDGVGGVMGYGAKKQLLDDGANPENISPVDTAITLDGNGNISIDSQTGMFKPVYLSFPDKFPANWKPLGIPSKYKGG